MYDLELKDKTTLTIYLAVEASVAAYPLCQDKHLKATTPPMACHLNLPLQIGPDPNAFAAWAAQPVVTNPYVETPLAANRDADVVKEYGITHRALDLV